MMDKRTTPARKSVAAAHLRGKVTAERFEEGTPMQVASTLLNLTTTADPAAPLATQLRAGEGFMVYEDIPDMGLSWGQCQRDGYVGFVYTEGLTSKTDTPLSEITALSALAIARPNVKSTVVGAYSFGCAVTVKTRGQGFAKLDSGVYLPEVTLAPLDTTDFVTLAEKFLNVPYMWGGRSSYGIDCSGLVQVALQGIARDAPRDSDMQEATLGKAVTGPMRRGDLVFWKGHVGIMQDNETLLHANAHHMNVTSEPLEIVAQRITKHTGGKIQKIRRI